MDSEADLIAHYDKRAPEYDQMYNRPEPLRRRELDSIGATLQETLAGRRVLEVACGTGYWTVLAAHAAAHIVAIDPAPTALAIARTKPVPPNRVEFRAMNAYELDGLQPAFDGGLANFWLSHVPKSRLDAFLRGFHGQLEPNAAVFMADNVFVPGVGGELQHVDGGEDTYKLRRLADGSPHTVVKNYYCEAELRQLLAPFADDVRVCVGKRYWWLWYLARGN